jgi:single stranded DNA-binding protein
MYQNQVTLIGFLCSNAEVRTNSNRSFTTFSLATTSSYKKDDKYISHTEWHRCVVFGKLSEFAKTLTKGAHIQVEGELRSREFHAFCACGEGMIVHSISWWCKNGASHRENFDTPPLRGCCRAPRGAPERLVRNE